MTEINRQAYRDAMAYLYCKIRNDQEGMATVAAGMDPGPTLDAMADMSLGIASIATEGRPTLWLNVVRDQLDALLDELERGGLA